ncbi:hypothetical protein SprV_0200700700 [Sparganum proliferum]
MDEALQKRPQPSLQHLRLRNRCLPQLETNADLNLPPSLYETIRAMEQLSSRKAPGSDAIAAEIYKHGATQLIEHLTALFQEMWCQGQVPQDFKDTTTIHLYKRKGLLPESQCSFHHHRGTTDIIFATCQLHEMCQEMRTHLHSTFVDLTKALDTVNREGLWKIMHKFGCPERSIQMVRQLHDGMMPRVKDNGVVSEAFAVSNGVKEGCVLASTLFSLMRMYTCRDERPGFASPTGRMANSSTTGGCTSDRVCTLNVTSEGDMFTAMLIDAYRDERPGIRIVYRADGQLLNQRRMHFQSRVSTAAVHELLFTDNCALNSTSERDMQRCMDISTAAAAAAVACGDFGLFINMEKTVVIYQPQPDADYNAPQANFTYLDSTLSRTPKIHDEVVRPISKASQAFGHLQGTVWNRCRLRLSTKQKMCKFKSASSSTSTINTGRTPEPSLPSSYSFSSCTISTCATAAPLPTTAAHNPDAPTNTSNTIIDTSGEELVYTYPHCDRAFPSHTGLVGHLRIHRTETDEPVPGAPTYTHCMRTFTHRMSLLRHMRTHENMR